MSAIDPLFGMHADALALQQKRMGLIASNLANADTPNYLARDIDFSKVLAKEQGLAVGGALPLASPQGAAEENPGRLTATDPLHIATSTPAAAAQDRNLAYRVPMQPAVDGNTVDTQVEKAKYLDAALHYEASLTFLNGRIHEMLTAITGQ